jgi:hypothetical protein
MGRPTKCTPEATAKVCEALALGVSWAAAAAHAGLTERCIMEWKARGAEGEEPFDQFLREATRARDAAETRMARIVVAAAEDGNASAAQWWLERRRPENWGRRDHNVVEVADPNKAVAALLAKLTEGESK